jgi:hypothetical protein
MAKGRMPYIMREAQRLCQIFIEAERARNGPANLRDLQTMRQPDAIMIPIRRNEHLCLVAETAECDRVNDPVPVPLKIITRAA